MKYSTLVLLLICALFLANPTGLIARNNVVIPTSTDLRAQASSQIFGGNFSTDPRQPQVKAAVGETGPQNIQIFIINHDQCAIKSDALTYRIFIRNAGTQLAQNLLLENTITGGTVIQNNDGAVLGNVLTIFFGGLAPNGFVETNFTVLADGGALSNVANLTFSGGAVQTTHIVNGDCNLPNPDTSPLPDRVATIICDISETACTNFFPDLGPRFSAANDRTTQVRVCSPNDPRGCVDNLPDLGPRFGDAEGVLLPGECRVVEDAALGFGAGNPLSGPPVETTYCESNGYPEFVTRNAPARAKEGNLTVPDTSGLNPNVAINPAFVAGSVCGGRPGDPFWADDCSCKCGDAIVCPSTGEVTLCELCPDFPLTRHDIFVTSEDECLLDLVNHIDPFF